LLLLILLPQNLDRPLPDQSSFLAEFRKTLRTPERLLSQYTYTEKETETKLDSKGRTDSTETNVYQVVNGAEDWQSYRRHISKNGVALSDKELEKQDAKERERVEKEKRKREGWSEAKRQEEKEKGEREGRETADDIFATFDYQLVRPEMVNGVSTILVNFTPKKDYKPKTREAKELQHVQGRFWVAEDEHQLVKLQAEVMDPISIGFGLLAKVQKGSTL